MASFNSDGASRSRTAAGMRGLAAMRAINSDWATPTHPSVSASAHSGSAWCRRAVWTRRCASGPDRRHMCLTAVLAEKNPCGRNGFDLSITPVAVMAAASTIRRSSSTRSNHTRNWSGSSCDGSTSDTAASAVAALDTASCARSAGGSASIEATRRNRIASRRSTPPRSPPPPAISSTPTELMLPIMTKGSHRVVSTTTRAVGAPPGLRSQRPAARLDRGSPPAATLGPAADADTARHRQQGFGKTATIRG